MSLARTANDTDRASQVNPQGSGKPEKKIDFSKMLSAKGLIFFLTLLFLGWFVWTHWLFPQKERTVEQGQMAYEPNVIPGDVEIVEHLSEKGWESIDFIENSAVHRVASINISPASAKAREIIAAMQEGRHKFTGRDGNTKLKNLLGSHYRTLITECERVGIFTLNQIYSLGKQDFILTVGGKGAMFIRISEVELLLKDRGYNIDFWRAWKPKTDLNPEDFKSKGIHTGLFKIAPAGPKTLEWVLRQKWSQLKNVRGVGEGTGKDLYSIIKERKGVEEAEKWINQ